MVDLVVDASGVILPVRVHAGARQNGVVGTRGGMLRVAVSAPPEKGKANQAIIAVLSKALGVRKSSITLLSGESSPNKRFLIGGTEAEEGADFNVAPAAGLITFLPGRAPPDGAAVSAGFLFDVPVRFDTDYLEVDLSAFAAGAIPKIPLVEIRP